MDEATLARVEAIFYNRLKALYERIEDLSLDDVNVNPFLVEFARPVLGMSGNPDVARFQVQQRLERALTGSVGTALAAAAHELAVGRSRKSRKQILILERDAGVFNVLMKSGPDSLNQYGISNARKSLRALASENGGEGRVGICYGRIEDLSSQTAALGREFRVIIGEEFWEFVTGSKDAYQVVLQSAKNASLKVASEEGGVGSLSRLIDDKAQRLGRQLERASPGEK